MLFPPLEWDFLVVNPQKIVGQNIRAYVANGNTMIFTGGIISLEFINRYFYYQLEPADGNLDPGPFLRLPKFQGMTEEQHTVISDGTPSTEPAPKTLPQVGIDVTSVKKESLPSGTSVVYTSPYNSALSHQVLRGGEPHELSRRTSATRQGAAPGLPHRGGAGPPVLVRQHLLFGV